MSRIYDLTFAAVAGASGNIPAMGDKVKVYSAPYGPVNVRTDTGENHTLLEGQGFTLPPGKTFRDLIVTNVNAVAQVVQVFAGDARIDDSRITGQVRVIDSSYDKSAALKQFMDGQTQAAIAGQWNFEGINANGKTVAIRRIWVTSPLVGDIRLGFTTSAGTANASGASLANKVAFAAASTCKVAFGAASSAAPSGAELPGFAPNYRATLAAGIPLLIDLSNAPIVISGTQGYGCFDLVGNRVMAVFFEAEEII